MQEGEKISLYLGNDRMYGHSYYRMRIGNRGTLWKWNHLERPITPISRSYHYLTLNISKTVRDADTVIMELIGTYTRPTQGCHFEWPQLQLDVVIAVRGGAIWWMRTKAKGRHGVVCRLNCVIHVWASWGRDTCHLGRYINPRTFTLYLYRAVCLRQLSVLYESADCRRRCCCCRRRRRQRYVMYSSRSVKY